MRNKENEIVRELETIREKTLKLNIKVKKNEISTEEALNNLYILEQEVAHWYDHISTNWRYCIGCLGRNHQIAKQMRRGSRN